MVKHTQTIRRLSPTNCLSVFDNFVGLAIKGLTKPFSALFPLKGHTYLDNFFKSNFNKIRPL